jgi:D-glycero-D-manno-heptose 1,7-bisphosphate phosphatase
VILDRDGTLIVEKHYLSRPEQVEIIPGAAEGLKRLRSLGYGAIIVTNQSGIGRGYFGWNEVNAVHRLLTERLEADGAIIDAIYVCPHRPADDCPCRKPRPGLIVRAAQDLGFDPAESFVIGDKECDVALGRAVGAYACLVETGYGKQQLADGIAHPDFVARDVAVAAESIGLLLKNRMRAIA